MKNKCKELLFTCKGDHTGMVIKREVEGERVCGRMEFMLSMLGCFAVPRQASGHRATISSAATKTSPAQSPVVLIKRKEFLPFPF